ncbi:hypothetical protein HD597_004639 [Nonomuraea thailandensis]|uniref:Uncharacterized protein n=1 Tax=Nonomuraea thailandensis TaxID=1188745 RepID=A0A9X2GHI3_9ACTN|nr:hypothetical protein [Nonomuraea thailandensis]
MTLETPRWRIRPSSRSASSVSRGATGELPSRAPIRRFTTSRRSTPSERRFAPSSTARRRTARAVSRPGRSPLGQPVSFIAP